jgi:tetratricopeptide (TPR) repeat protein
MQFRRRIKIAPGVYVNVSKGGLSLSLGTKGLRYTIGKDGSQVNVGLPGTGVYYRKHLGKPGTNKADEQQSEAAPRSGSKRRSRHKPGTQTSPQPAALPANASPVEQAFHKGSAAYLQGDYQAAFDAFSRLLESTSDYRSDSLLMHALSASALNHDDVALDSLTALVEQGQEPLPGTTESLIARLLPEVTVEVPITQYSSVEQPLNMGTAILLLSELMQAQGELPEAVQFIQDLYQQMPDDPVLQLSLADLDAQAKDYDALYELVSQNAKHLDNDSDVALELMYYWANALTAKEMYEAAEEVYRNALKGTASRNPELVKLVEYARADLYERQGKTDDAYKYFSRLLAEDPQFFDVEERATILKPAG